MRAPTVRQYMNVIDNHMSDKQRKVLCTLYYSPDSAATAGQLALAMDYKSWQAANRQIGGIGEVIFNVTKIDPGSYVDRGVRKRYWLLIGDYDGIRGWVMRKPLKTALENLGLVSIISIESTNIERYPNESANIRITKKTEEGSLTQILVNKYERNRVARAECIAYYKPICQVCDFDFEMIYGKEAAGFIHVHHIVLMSERKGAYIVDPIKDLVPLCANCHSAIHIYDPMPTVARFRKLFWRRNKK